ncbi:transcriptional regulatory protein [Seiridium cupressi]
MEMEDMSLEVAEKDTAAEIAAEAAVADPANRTTKRSSNTRVCLTVTTYHSAPNEWRAYYCLMKTCQPCRLRKVKCLIGDGTSCANCERLGFTCSFADTSPQGDGDSNAQVSLPRRRVRLACINCHSRKARCSGETPTCARCQAQGIDCVYRPTKRSGGALTGQPGNSDHESVSSEPPEKRRMTTEDACARTVRGPNDHGNLNGGYSSWPPNHESSADPISASELLLTQTCRNITFPDETIITRTFNNFFRHIHHVPVFSFMHRASLMQRYHAGMMDKPLLLALVGITSLLTDLGPGMREYGTKCIDECQRMILADLENPSTIKIQALVFIMKHRMLNRRFTSAFMLASLAGRFAYALRLNYENPNLCFLARESRRRLMWAFLTIDSGINGGYPDFTLLPSEALHVQLPCNERNFEFDLPQVTGHLKPIPTTPFPDDVGSLALHVRLLWIRSRILYCTKNVIAMPETELAELPRLVEVLAQELKLFNEHLPASFRFSESNLRLRAYSPRLCVFIMIHIWFRQCYCDLYRIVMTGLKEALPRSSLDRLPPQFVALCERQCYEHAVAMVDIFRLTLSLDGGLPVTDLDLSACAYQCARMIYFVHHMNSSSEFQLTADQMHDHAQKCLQITRHMMHIPAGLAIHSDLEKLVSRGLSASTTPSYPGSPDASRIPPRQVLSRHNPVHQMNIVDHSEIPSTQSPSVPILSPLNHSNMSGGSEHHTPVSQPTPASRPVNFGEVPNYINDMNMPKPNLPPVDPPEGLDNNNAFEGAMDGFDFNFESFGNTGLESVSWFSQEWLNQDLSQTV